MLNRSLLLLALIATAIMGCKDEDKSPIVTQDTLLFGAFPRLVTLRSGEFDLDNLTTSTYEMEVDFVDNAEGNDIDTYEIYVSFDDNSIDSLSFDLSTSSNLFRTYESSEFRAGPNGNLGLDVIISFSDVAAATGVPLDSVMAGDRFQFTTITTKKDGRQFGTENSTSAVTSAFGGIFDFNVTATCPLSDDTFVGEYELTYGYVYEPLDLFGRTIQAFGPQPLNRTVTLSLVEGSTTQRTFSTDYLAPSNLTSNITNTLDFACTRINASWSDSGVACSGDGWRPIQEGTANFDLSNDNTFTIEYRDFGDGADGNCGIGAALYSIKYTKK